MDYNIKFYISPKDSFEAEGRYFYKGGKYPVYDKKGASLLVGENGEFYFTNELMDEAIKQWELEVINN